MLQFASVAEELEKHELEGATGEELADLHSQLLCVYLCNFDMCNAKFLWKRILKEEKAAYPIIGQIWDIGKKIWAKDHNAVFALIRNTKWPNTIEPYMCHLEEVYRQKSLQLIGKAYLTINAATFASLIGYQDHPEEAEQMLNKLKEEQGWSYDATAQLIIPKRPSAPSVPLMRNEDQLQSLTQFVSFLEN